MELSKIIRAVLIVLSYALWGLIISLKFIVLVMYSLLVAVLVGLDYFRPVLRRGAHFQMDGSVPINPSLQRAPQEPAPPEKQDKNKEKRTCFECGKTGHIAVNCRVRQARRKAEKENAAAQKALEEAKEGEAPKE